MSVPPGFLCCLYEKTIKFKDESEHQSISIFIYILSDKILSLGTLERPRAWVEQNERLDLP